jgi:Helix-turn-helix domain
MEETSMRGRYPWGPEYVEQLTGSAQAKQRAKIILETVTGKLRVQEACQILGISEQRFGQLRQEMLQAGVASLEAQSAGRPRSPSEAPEVSALREQLLGLQDELRAAQVREEIALTLPDVVHEPAQPEKKSARRSKRKARPGWWKKK